jgi:hypothetical protein
VLVVENLEILTLGVVTMQVLAIEPVVLAVAVEAVVVIILALFYELLVVQNGAVVAVEREVVVLVLMFMDLMVVVLFMVALVAVVEADVISVQVVPVEREVQIYTAQAVEQREVVLV